MELEQRERFVEYALPEGYGEDDGSDGDASDTTADKAHAAYMRDKRERERAMDLAYEAYVAGTGGGAVVDLAAEHIQMKAATQYNLRHLRQGNSSETIDDHLQEFLMEILPRIEQKKITGRLSYYINVAFKLHFIDAKKTMKREWDWRRFLAASNGRDSEGNVLSRADVDVSEWHSSASPDHIDPAEPNPTAITDEDREAEALGYAAGRQFGDRLRKRSNRPAPARTISRRAEADARTRFLRKHKDDLHGAILYKMSYPEDIDGKRLASTFGVSESTVSRSLAYIQSEIRRIAEELEQQREPQKSGNKAAAV